MQYIEDNEDNQQTTITASLSLIAHEKHQQSIREAVAKITQNN